MAGFFVDDTSKKGCADQDDSAYRAKKKAHAQGAKQAGTPRLQPILA